MITPEQFLKIEIQLGRCEQNPSCVARAKKAIAQLSSYRSLKTIDYGAGTGVYANQLQELGFDVVAQDIWHAHRDYMEKQYPGLKIVKEPIPAELMVFIEVAEHMTDAEIRQALKIINPLYVLFSSISTPRDDDEEWGHINLKTQPEWDKFWATMGYRKIRSLNRPTTWSKIYQKI